MNKYKIISICSLSIVLILVLSVLLPFTTTANERESLELRMHYEDSTVTANIVVNSDVYTGVVCKYIELDDVLTSENLVDETKQNGYTVNVDKADEDEYNATITDVSKRYVVIYVSIGNCELCDYIDCRPAQQEEQNQNEEVNNQEENNQNEQTNNQEENNQIEETNNQEENNQIEETNNQEENNQNEEANNQEEQNQNEEANNQVENNQNEEVNNQVENNQNEEASNQEDNNQNIEQNNQESNPNTDSNAQVQNNNDRINVYENVSENNSANSNSTSNVTGNSTIAESTSSNTSNQQNDTSSSNNSIKVNNSIDDGEFQEIKSSNKISTAESSMPQTGENDSIKIIGIVVFGIISVASFYKYKTTK